MKIILILFLILFFVLMVMERGNDNETNEIVNFYLGHIAHRLFACILFCALLRLLLARE